MARKHIVSHGKHRFLPFLVATIFITLFAVSAWMFWRQTRTATDLMIHQDVMQLQKIFEKIDQDCKIMHLKHEKNYIDFLTVKEFVGSEIGGLNLTYAARWQGPYETMTPTIQEQPYVLLRNKQGYFIVPADGVVLSNGKKIGVDIILNEKSDMNKLLQDTNGLLSPSGVLAVKLDIETNRLKNLVTQPSIFEDMY